MKGQIFESIKETLVSTAVAELGLKVKGKTLRLCFFYSENTEEKKLRVEKKEKKLEENKKYV